MLLLVVKTFSYEFDTNSTYSHLLFAARPENKDDLAGRTVVVTVATDHDHVGRFILAAAAAPAGYMLEKFSYARFHSLPCYSAQVYSSRSQSADGGL
jgi:hypothetical protein